MSPTERRSGPPAWIARATPWAALAVLAALAVAAMHTAGNDVQVFRRAGERFWAGAPLYPPGDGFYSLRYAPGVAVLFSPLAPLSPGAARVVWAAITVLVLLAIERLLARRSAGRPWAALAGMLLLAMPVANELQYGQVNALLLLLVLLGFEAEDRGSEGWAGASLAFPVAAKVSPILLGLDLLARRRWRAILGLALGGAVVVLLPAVRYGLAGTFHQHLAWIGLDAEWSSDVNALTHNQSVWALVAWLGGSRIPGALAAAGVVAAAASEGDRELRRGLLLLAVPLASPCGWIQNFLWGIPLVATLVARGGRVARAGAVLAGSSLLLSWEVLGRARLEWALAHRLLAVEMVALLLVARFLPRGERRSTLPASRPFTAPAR